MAAAGAAVLLALSAAIGVRGWPGLDGGTVTVQGISARASAHRPAPRQRLGGHAGPTARSAARHVLAGTESAPDNRPRTPAAASPPHASRPTPAAAASPAAPAAAHPAAPAVPATHKGTPAGDLVRGAGDTAGSVAAPVSPAAAQTVTSATDTAANAVDKLTP